MPSSDIEILGVIKPDGCAVPSEETGSEQPRAIEMPPFTREKYNYLVGWLGKINDEDAAEIYPILHTIRFAHRG